MKLFCWPFYQKFSLLDDDHSLIVFMKESLIKICFFRSIQKSIQKSLRIYLSEFINYKLEPEIILPIFKRQTEIINFLFSSIDYFFEKRSLLKF